MLGSSICLWGELFQPAFVEKVGILVQGKLDNALDAVKLSVDQNYVKFDMKTWLWTEAPNDLPQSAISPSNSSGKIFPLKFERTFLFNCFFSMQGLYMKTRCYMPTVQQICSLWDQKLTILREDLAHYQEGKTDEESVFSPFNKFEKRTQINEDLEKHTLQSVKK